MKFRNKKTGEIKDFGNLQVYAETENTDESQLLGNFDSFKQILEYYEDYILPEPLIKDEKIRKAVRTWAEANGYTKLWVYHDHTTISFYNEDDGDNEITFNTMEKFGLENLKCYTITELCGEEEE